MDFLDQRVIRNPKYCSIARDPNLGHGTNSAMEVLMLKGFLSISKTWDKFESLAIFKLGNRRKIYFWSDSWCLETSFKVCFPRQFRFASLPNGSINDHWDTATSSWSFRR